MQKQHLWWFLGGVLVIVLGVTMVIALDSNRTIKNLSNRVEQTPGNIGAEDSGGIVYPLDPFTVTLVPLVPSDVDFDQAIVGKDASGKIVTAVPSVREEIDRILAFYMALPDYPIVWFRETCTACDGGPGALHAFDTRIGKFVALEGDKGLNTDPSVEWQVSHDRTRILSPVPDLLPNGNATNEVRRIYVYNLLSDTGRHYIELRPNESLTEQVIYGLGESSQVSISWINDRTIEYAVYDASSPITGPAPGQEFESTKRRLIEKRRVVVE